MPIATIRCYEGDPDTPKVVQKEHWFETPAKTTRRGLTAGAHTDERTTHPWSTTHAEIVDGFGFENPHVHEAMLYLATFWGLDPNEAEVGHVAVLWLYCMMNASLARSGNVAAAKAMYQSFLRSGGDYPGNVRVERTLISGQRAIKHRDSFRIAAQIADVQTGIVPGRCVYAGPDGTQWRAPHRCELP